MGCSRCATCSRPAGTRFGIWLFLTLLIVLVGLTSSCSAGAVAREQRSEGGAGHVPFRFRRDRVLAEAVDQPRGRPGCEHERLHGDECGGAHSGGVRSLDRIGGSVAAVPGAREHRLHGSRAGIAAGGVQGARGEGSSPSVRSARPGGLGSGRAPERGPILLLPGGRGHRPQHRSVRACGPRLLRVGADDDVRPRRGCPQLRPDHAGGKNDAWGFDAGLQHGSDPRARLRRDGGRSWGGWASCWCPTSSSAGPWKATRTLR